MSWTKLFIKENVKKTETVTPDISENSVVSSNIINTPENTIVEMNLEIEKITKNVIDSLINSSGKLKHVFQYCDEIIKSIEFLKSTGTIKADIDYEQMVKIASALKKFENEKYDITQEYVNTAVKVETESFEQYLNNIVSTNFTNNINKNKDLIEKLKAENIELAKRIAENESVISNTFETNLKMIEEENKELTKNKLMVTIFNNSITNKMNEYLKIFNIIFKQK